MALGNMHLYQKHAWVELIISGAFKICTAELTIKSSKVKVMGLLGYCHTLKNKRQLVPKVSSRHINSTLLHAQGDSNSVK